MFILNEFCPHTNYKGIEKYVLCLQNLVVIICALPAAFVYESGYQAVPAVLLRTVLMENP